MKLITNSLGEVTLLYIPSTLLPLTYMYLSRHIPPSAPVILSPALSSSYPIISHFSPLTSTSHHYHSISSTLTIPTSI